MQQKRQLIIISIVHTQADFGILRSKVPVDQQYETMATQYWQAVSEYVQTLPVDFSKLRIYQDGLPDLSTEKVARIVDEAQTPNYEVLRRLRDKGANIVGTESLPLLLQEYRGLQAIFNSENEEQKHEARLKYAKVSPYLLKGRDEYIAKRIKDTLSEGGMGILFIGLAHEVKRLLEQEMEINEPETLIGGSSEALREKLRLYGKEREL